MEELKKNILEKIKACENIESVNIEEWLSSHNGAALFREDPERQGYGWVIISSRDAHGLRGALDEALLIEPEASYRIVE